MNYGQSVAGTANVVSPPIRRGYESRIPAGTPAVDPNRPAPPSTSATRAAAPAYFRPVTDIHDRIHRLASQFPQLVQVIQLGSTAQDAGGRPLIAMRVSADAGKASAMGKPGVLMLGGVHAREIANPELLMGWAEALVKGYGTDPAATALLDGRRLIVFPVVNPDGHAIVERAYSDTKYSNGLMQRVNNRKGGGVDLNRNFPFHWGEVGSSDRPGSETYRGPAAASEPETQAVMKLVESEKPAMVQDWHSHGGMVLAPFGHNEVPKDDAGMRAIGAAIKRQNGYRVMTSWEFGSGSGTSKDWVYGVHNIPAFTVETGNSFLQSDKEFADTVKVNRPVLEQSLYMADAPYERSQGPDAALRASAQGALTVELNAVPGPVKKGAPAPAAITVAGAELVKSLLDKPGSGTVLTAADGVFDSARESIALPVGAGLADAFAGAQYLLIRGRDSAGRWGNPVAIAPRG